MTQQVTINEAQKAALKTIVDGGRQSADTFNKRTIFALENRGLVKTTENKKGIFVAPTAKGKKALN